MRVRNSAGRLIETSISGNSYKPFSGAKKYFYKSKVVTLTEALTKCGIKDGMTLSFHHQLRNGDFVINKTLETVKNLGIKNMGRLETVPLYAYFNKKHKIYALQLEKMLHQMKQDGTYQHIVSTFEISQLAE